MTWGSRGQDLVVGATGVENTLASILAGRVLTSEAMDPVTLDHGIAHTSLSSVNRNLLAWLYVEMGPITEDYINISEINIQLKKLSIKCVIVESY